MGISPFWQGNNRRQKSGYLNLSLATSGKVLKPLSGRNLAEVIRKVLD